MSVCKQNQKKAENKNRTPFFFASQSGNSNIVLELLKRGADVNTFDYQKITPLMNAVRNKDDKMIDILLSRDADPNLQNREGWTALMSVCAKEGGSETIIKLLNRDADPNIESLEGGTALMVATQTGLIENINTLLNHSNKVEININVKDVYNRTSLLYSAVHGFGDITNILLKLGAKTDVQDKHGMTALMYACLFGYDDISSKLLEHDADTRLKDKDGNTAYSYAEKIFNLKDSGYPEGDNRRRSSWTQCFAKRKIKNMIEEKEAAIKKARNIMQ